MLIKIILICSVLIIATFLVRGTANTKNVALRRLLLIAFVALAVISIIFPEITTQIAHLLGVGRGVDLMVYLLIIAFLSYSVVSYRRINILESRIIDLAREQALITANPKYQDSTEEKN
ncbi:MAG: DUF2304 domain-containing protein [Arcanobacterium sp.]|nr:DUF2304 domain-containing protein [Arcanobacterium sp.]